jgi:hypothetical protein
MTPSNSSGHYLANLFLTAAFNLRKKNGTANYSLMLRWTVGHIDIEGNELADKEAKLAAEGTMSGASHLPKTLKKPLKYNKSAAKQAHNTKLKDAWNKAWHKSPHAQKSKLIDSTIPSQKFLKLISDPDISRKGASWLFQLRTGHIPLNAYLHRFKRTESAKCPACGYHNETPQHFLLDCPAYAHKRWMLTVGKTTKNKGYTALLGSPKNAIPLINYIQATGRFTMDRNGPGGGTAPRGVRHTETGERENRVGRRRPREC